MRGRFSLSWTAVRTSLLVGAAITLIVTVAAGSFAGEVSSEEARRPCTVEGSWLASVDIGAVFFVDYGHGATRTSGGMAIEWIGFDPTLFGNFPTAVRVTQAMGAWHQVNAAEYLYTWIFYGFDASGTPLYSVRGSGTGIFSGCDVIVFDYVLEVFPYPLDPLVDDPVSCLSGIGTKYRIPVVEATCDP